MYQENPLLPLITIIIPVYNLEDYVACCMDSAVGQTYSNLEIVAVNDGSRDRSREILEEYAARDKRVKIINKENGGLIMARKTGIEASTGDFVFFLDGDDHIAPDTIEVLYKLLTENGCDMVSSPLLRVSGSYSMPLKNNNPPSLAEGYGFLKAILEHMMFTSVAGKLYRRSLFAKINYYKEISLWEDYIINLQIAVAHRPRVYFTEKSFYYYIQRKGSLNRSKDRLEYLKMFYGRVREVLAADPRVADECRDEILIDRIHWYHIYIKKSRNPWIGGTDYAVELYKDVVAARRRLKGRVPGSTICVIRMYRRRWLRPAVKAVETLRRLNQSLARRRQGGGQVSASKIPSQTE